MTAFSEQMSSFTCDFFILSFKKFKKGMMLYGRSKYDHQNGTMSFTKPGQVIELKDIEFEEKGFVIAFHEDYILTEMVYKEVLGYGFFEYEVQEALHVGEKEATIMWSIYEKLDIEYNNNQDECSKSIILSHIISILRYANRFYKRQFLNRQIPSSRILTKFDQELRSLLNDESGTLPRVNEIAQNLGISSRYLSDLLKQETGKTAIEHIHIQLVNEAKNMLSISDLSISETAFRLGFEHPTYFSRLFKKLTGLSPKEYRKAK